MKEYPVRYDLPASMFRDIGRVIVLWAYLEQYAQQLIYKLLQVDPKQGRVALSQGDLPSRYENIETLAFLRDIDVERMVMELKGMADKYKTKRDLLAHSIWFFSTERQYWMVQTTKGSKSGAAHVSKHLRKRKVSPAGVPMAHEELMIMSANLEDMIQDTRALELVIDEQLTPSPRKPPTQSPKQGSSRAQSPKKPRTRHRPSQE